MVDRCRAATRTICGRISHTALSQLSSPKRSNTASLPSDTAVVLVHRHSPRQSYKRTSPIHIIRASSIGSGGPRHQGQPARHHPSHSSGFRLIHLAWISVKAQPEPVASPLRGGGAGCKPASAASSNSAIPAILGGSTPVNDGGSLQ